MRTPPNPVWRDVLTSIEEAIRSIRYGSVQIIIHDSKVVQIEKAEKIRVDTHADLPAPRLPVQFSGRQTSNAQETSQTASPVEVARQAGLTSGGDEEDLSRADQMTGGMRPSEGG